MSEYVINRGDGVEVDTYFGENGITYVMSDEVVAQRIASYLDLLVAVAQRIALLRRSNWLTPPNGVGLCSRSKRYGRPIPRRAMHPFQTRCISRFWTS